MKIKAVRFKKPETRKRTIIIKMSEGKQLFFDLVAKVEESGKIKTIIASEVGRYLSLPFKH